LALPETVAWNCSEDPVCTVPLAGATLTAIVEATVAAAVGVPPEPGVAVAAMVRLASIPDVAVGTLVGVEAIDVAVGIIMVGVAAISVRAVEGVDVATRVGVRVMVGVEVLVRVAVRTVVGVGAAATLRTSGVDTASGPGFTTVMLTEPAVVAVPVAISRVEEENVVASATPFHNTLAPLTKRLPTTYILNGPNGMGFGARLVVNGVWLRTVITQVA